MVPIIAMAVDCLTMALDVACAHIYMLDIL